MNTKFEFWYTEIWYTEMTAKTTGNLATRIRSALAQEIESGKLQPGSPLDERSLATRFKVSRTPVREALQQLAAIGLVSGGARNGASVSRMSVGELRSTLELLAEMEAICAKFAARRISDAQREKLDRAVAACAKAATAGDGKAYQKANREFHAAIYDASANEYLVHHVLAIRRMTERYRINDLKFPPQLARSLRDHRAIAKAILDSDPQAAYQAMLDHVPIGTTGFSEMLARLPASYFD